ncbi:natural cytotoxicity triggering receptor 3 [Engystomops pustulosus]|uniref:natural cytotoxicity triggering receptor 3 n=1 Tax=Engystomops pustulosus TaxID=76066 RepID=UPI003AFB3BAD
MEISSLLKILLVAHHIFFRTAVYGQTQLVVTQPEMVQAQAGDSVNISCSFTSSSPTYTVTWTVGALLLQDHPCFQHRVKVSTPDHNQTNKVHSYESQTTVTVLNLTENDSGIFFCHVKTGDRETGTGPGTTLVVNHRSLSAESFNMLLVVMEIIRIICLVILIILLGLAVKKSC